MSRVGHIKRYGAWFFGLCVLVATWQFTAMVADLRVMGRGFQEGMMAPLLGSNFLALASPFQGLYIALSSKLGSMSLFGTISVSLANVLLILSPYWLLPRRWRWLLWIPMILFTVWCLTQLWYCRVYEDLMPWQSLMLTDNVNTTLMQSTLALLRWHDLFIVLPLLLLVVVHIWSRPSRATGREPRLKPFLLTVLAAVLGGLPGYASGFTNYNNRFVHNFSNKGYFSQNGIIPYAVFTLNEVFKSHSLDDEELARLEHFLAEECPQYSDNRYCSVERRNLVLIIVESLHTWPIGMTVEGREVTPVINRLVASDSVFYAPHVMFQTSHGHSSDAHFIYNTGLLPLRDAAVAVTWGAGPYPSLAEALEGYDCREVICTPGMNWNQNVTSRTYGFDTLYTRDHMMADGAFQRHNYMDDAALTDYAAKLLPQLRQPFFLEMVTMTMHTPYPVDKVRRSWITASDTLNAEARGYLNCVNVTDSCIGAFIGDLHRLGLDRNTVVAIVSDHTQVYLNRIEGRHDDVATADDWGIPLIVIGADTTLRYEPVIGQVDVFPTLLDVMGANAYRWKGLGHSILRYPVESAIFPRNMSVIGDSTALTPQQRRAWDISRYIIYGGYHPESLSQPSKKNKN